MGSTKWADDKFLDGIRSHCDAAADDCVAQLPETFDYSAVFRRIQAGTDPIPPDAPGALRAFFDETRDVPRSESDTTRFPDGIDHARLARGKDAFLDHAILSMVVLLAKSMPEGYAAPCLSRLLALSGNLQHHPFKRLIGVLQMVADIMSPHAFQRFGRAPVTAQKMRLMHAGIRKFARTQWTEFPDYHAKYGEPVNLEDKLGTLMGLSLLVITGLQQLHVGLTDEAAEDYYYVWRVYGQMMGIHPPSDRHSTEFIPGSLAEAREFYASYERRHYVQAPDNPKGVELANLNLQMLEYFIPSGLRAVGFQGAANFYMTELIGDAGCARVGIKPTGDYPVTRALLQAAVYFQAGLGNFIDAIGLDSLHHAVSRMLLAGLVTVTYDGTVTFAIPQSINEIQGLVKEH